MSVELFFLNDNSYYMFSMVLVQYVCTVHMCMTSKFLAYDEYMLLIMIVDAIC